MVVAALVWGCSGDRRLPGAPDGGERERDLTLAPVDSVFALRDLPAPQEAAPPTPPPPPIARPERSTPKPVESRTQVLAAVVEPPPPPPPEPPPPLSEFAESSAPTEAPPPPSAPAGTAFAITVNAQVSSRTGRVGDPVSATVTNPVRDEQGRVVIPAGSVIRGTVTELSAPDRTGGGGRIRLTFTSVVVDGESYPINAVASDLPTRVTETVTKSGESTLSRAGKGAILGGILGGLLGKGKGAVIGAGAGAVAGAASGGGGDGSRFFEIALAAGSGGSCVLGGPFSLPATLRAQ